MFVPKNTESSRKIKMFNLPSQRSTMPKPLWLRSNTSLLKSNDMANCESSLLHSSTVMTEVDNY